jgi:hypothetical protein
MPATHEVQVEYIDGWSYLENDYLIWELERGARVVAAWLFLVLVNRVTIQMIQNSCMHFCVRTSGVRSIAALGCEYETQKKLLFCQVDGLSQDEVTLYLPIVCASHNSWQADWVKRSQ